MKKNNFPTRAALIERIAQLKKRGDLAERNVRILHAENVRMHGFLKALSVGALALKKYMTERADS